MTLSFKISTIKQALADFFPILLKILLKKTTVANSIKNSRSRIVLNEVTKSLCNFCILGGFAVTFCAMLEL